MEKQIELQKDPYGLGGGILISGSINKTMSGSGAWCYYPLETSTAIVNTSNIISGSAITFSGSLGAPLYGDITAVSQSSGVAIVYFGSFKPPIYG